MILASRFNKEKLLDSISSEAPKTCANLKKVDPYTRHRSKFRMILISLS
jgi:hypothetical protein